MLGEAKAVRISAIREPAIADNDGGEGGSPRAGEGWLITVVGAFGVERGRFGRFFSFLVRTIEELLGA
jgi:hypothetical protein